ncbi:hypothetical protein Tco_0367441 [Tanacetum coccineum]
MNNSKKEWIPIAIKNYLSDDQSPPTPKEQRWNEKVPYVSSMFQKDPGKEHWTAVKNTLRNLRRTNDMFLDYGGYVFIMNDGAVAWRSSKQDTIAMSSTKAKYIVVLEVTQVAY